MFDQFGNKVTHAFVAPGKDARVMVVALVGMLTHELEIANQIAVRACRNRRLVHVQGAGKSRSNLRQV